MDSRISLEGKVAAVTGAGAGIGRGIAEALAAFGANVALLERDPERARTAAAAIESAGGRALALPVDVREPEPLEEALAATCSRLGGIDVLVNNAGGVFAAPFLETTPKGWSVLWRANFEHVLHATRFAAARMVERRRGGAILNVSSIEGVRAAPRFAVYAAAKAAMLSFTRTMALELAPHGIRVNALAPDICETEGLCALMSEEERQRAACTVPLGRLGRPDDMGGAAVFLCSDLAAYVTGQVLHVDGGTHAAAGWYHDPADGSYVYGPPPGSRRERGGGT